MEGPLSGNIIYRSAFLSWNLDFFLGLFCPVLITPHLSSYIDCITSCTIYFPNVNVPILVSLNVSVKNLGLVLYSPEEIFSTPAGPHGN